jgi:putative transcriptional regulator
VTADRDDVALAALGLAAPEAAAALDRDPPAAAEVAALAAAAAALAELVAPVPPAAHVRARLLAAVGGGPLERFAARFAAMYDVAVDRARELLGWVDDPRPWRQPFPGMQFAVFRGGPAHAGADCGLLRVAPGAAFPWHAHTSEETSLFLAGAGRDHLGALYVAGDELVLPAGSAHAFHTVGDVALILAVRHRGVDFAARRPAP